MKLTQRQLRALIKEELTQARRKGGGRASLGFAIPEDSWGESGIGSYEAVEGREAAQMALNAVDKAAALLKADARLTKLASAASTSVAALLKALDAELEGDEV